MTKIDKKLTFLLVEKLFLNNFDMENQNLDYFFTLNTNFLTKIDKKLTFLLVEKLFLNNFDMENQNLDYFFTLNTNFLTNFDQNWQKIDFFTCQKTLLEQFLTNFLH